MSVAPGFGAMKARRLRSLLERELGYVAKPGTGGSHRKLEAPGRPQLTFAFHDGDEVGAAMVRTILVRQVGLTLDEAKQVVKRG
jgi:predicted RNA binding protein YcfA (HicA-like mRNA interferase family)